MGKLLHFSRELHLNNKQIKLGLEGNMQVYGLVSQIEEGIWPFVIDVVVPYASRGNT